MIEIKCQGQHPRRDGLCNRKILRTSRDVIVHTYSAKQLYNTPGDWICCDRCGCWSHVQEVKKELAA